MQRTRATIAKLLSHIGGRKEVDQYLRHYSSIDTHKFAVIKISGGLLDDALGRVAASLSFLHEVGLYPIVVHGFGPHVERALQEAGLMAPLHDGVRQLSAAAFEVTRRVYQSEGLRLAEMLRRHGCAAQPMPPDVLEGQRQDEHSMTGSVRQVCAAPIEAALRTSQLPLVASLAVTPSGQSLYVDGDAAAAALAMHFEPHKIVVLTQRGGLIDGRGELIEAVNLTEDHERLRAPDSGLEEAMRAFLSTADTLLRALPERCSVSVTSPDQLARELFTHRGAGTLIRRGERVLRYEDFATINRSRLRSLLQDCFGKQLTGDYFTKKQCYRLYLTESYRATAIITHEAGYPYLDKFAVTAKAQGEGLGASLWARIRAENPQLFWRAKIENRVNSWYFQQADGSYKSDRWVVFWYGIDAFADIERCVQTALRMPQSLHLPRPPGAPPP